MTENISHFTNRLLESEWHIGLGTSTLRDMLEFADLKLLKNGDEIYECLCERGIHEEAKRMDEILTNILDGPFQQLGRELEVIVKSSHATPEQRQLLHEVIDSLKFLVKCGKFTTNDLKQDLQGGHDFSAEEVWGPNAKEIAEVMRVLHMYNTAQAFDPAIENGGLMRGMLTEFEMIFGDENTKGTIPEIIEKLEELETVLN